MKNNICKLAILSILLFAGIAGAVDKKADAFVIKQLAYSPRLVTSKEYTKYTVHIAWWDSATIIGSYDRFDGTWIYCGETKSGKYIPVGKCSDYILEILNSIFLRKSMP